MDPLLGKLGPCHRAVNSEPADGILWMCNSLLKCTEIDDAEVKAKFLCVSVQIFAV